MAAGRGPGRDEGAEAATAASTRPRRAVPEPDWAAPRGPRPDGADVSPAPARRLARQSPGPVPCLSNAGLPCLSSTGLAPASPKSGSSHCLSNPAFHPGNPGPLRLGLPLLG